MFGQKAESTDMPVNFVVSKTVTSNVLASLGVQIFLAAISGLITDGGQIGQIVMYAIAVNAVMTGFILVRRSQRPTKGDLIALRSGFLFVLLAIGFLFPVVWMLRGLL